MVGYVVFPGYRSIGWQVTKRDREAENTVSFIQPLGFHVGHKFKEATLRSVVTSFE